jgi:hypothetical protein
MRIAQAYGASNSKTDLYPALGTLQVSPFIVAQHEQCLNFLKSWKAEDFRTHLSARSLGIELSGLDRVISCLLHELFVEASSLSKEG